MAAMFFAGNLHNDSYQKNAQFWTKITCNTSKMTELGSRNRLKTIKMLDNDIDSC